MLTLFVRFMLLDSRKMKKKSENSRIPAECAQKQTKIDSELSKIKHWRYITISYKMLTLFVRFMLWDSRKMKKNQKTVVFQLNAHKNRQKEKNTFKQWNHCKIKHWRYRTISYEMLTLFVRFMLWDSRKMKKKSENSRIPAECAQKQRQK